MQSKYGATAAHAAEIWAGNLSDTDSQVFKTMGYYWHAPQDVDSNRGLGCAAHRPHATDPTPCVLDPLPGRLCPHCVATVSPLCPLNIPRRYRSARALTSTVSAASGP